MAVWFVSRHLGAVAWAKSKNIHIDYWVDHLNTPQNEVIEGDIVIGSLPINLVPVSNTTNA